MHDIHEWILNNLDKTAEYIIVEGGSADGADTDFFAQNFPNAKIYGFEPEENLYQKALKRNQENANVHLEKAALSSQNGTANFYISDRFGEDWGSSSLLKPKDHLWFHKEITFIREYKVKTLNLDSWCQNNSIQRIDFLWMDVQGSEPIIVKSSPNVIENTKYVYTEVSLIETYENVVLYSDFRNLMVEMGFKIVFEDLPWGDMGNVLFERV